MRSLLSKISALAVVVFMLATLMAVPSASAQTYPPVAPPPVNCASLAPPSIAIVGTNLVITFPQGTLTCIIRVVVEINPVLYDGPPPVGDTMTLPIPALAGDEWTATVTATSTFGQELSDSVSISPATLAAARANFAASGLAGSASVPAAAAVPVAPQNLAFTGGDVNLPLAAGALLIGAGGLTLLAARKREQEG